MALGAQRVARKKSVKKAPARRLRAAERAEVSGFPKKLTAWLAANDRARQEGAVSHGPHSAERLAKVITALGERVSPATIYRWRDGAVLPESRYIPILERLLGAPFSYLDDPKTPWPRPWDREAVSDLLTLLSDDDVEDLVRQVRRALDRRDDGAGSR